MLINQHSTTRQKPRRSWFLLSVLILVAGLLAGCAQVRTGTPPTISAFTADPLGITQGDDSTLSWEVEGADRVVLNPGNVQVSGTGSTQVQPGETTTYTLTASNKRGSATASVQIRVRAPTDPPLIGHFDANPESIARGQESMLSWSIAGADTVRITPGLGEVDATGSSAVTPEETTLYTLTATNAFGSSNLQVLITITEPGDGGAGDQPVITSFAAAPEAIDAGQDSTLSWNVSGATSISISPDVGTVSAAGNTIVSPSATTTYTLTAIGANGAKATETVTLSVRQDPDTSVPLIGSFSADPEQIIKGGSSLLSWAVAGAESISIDEGIGIVDANGTRSVAPDSDTTYTLTASNANGEVTESVTILVTDEEPGDDQLPPAIAVFLADPASGNAPFETTLHWLITGSPEAFGSAELDFGDSSAELTITSPAGTAVHGYAEAGIYHPVLTVHHKDGGTSVKSTTVAVSAATAGEPPEITSLSIDPETGRVPLSVTADWTADGSDLTCRIDFGAGSTPMVPTSCVSGSAAHQYAEPGVYTVTLAVMNADGKTTQESREVTVLPDPDSGLNPRITGFTANPTVGLEPLDVNFEWSVTSPSGVTPTTWLFYGDGSIPESGNSPASHTYQNVGEYDAVLVAVTEGGYDLKRLRISVGPAGSGEPGDDEFPLAVISAGPSLLSLDTEQSSTLNMLLGGLLGTDVQLDAVDYNGIASLDLNLLGFLEAVAGAGTPALGLTADLTVAELIDLLVTAADGNTAALAALDKLQLLSLPGTQIQLADLLNVDLMDGMLANANLNALELLVGSIQLMNHKNLLDLPDGITLDLAPLLSGAGADSKIHIRARVIEPPVIVYASSNSVGTAKAEFHSAAVRLALELEGLGVALDVSDTDAALGGLLDGIVSLVMDLLALVLSVDVDLELDIVSLGVYADVAGVDGFLASLDAVNPNVRLEVTPGIANLFIGEIADSLFFSASPINDSDVMPGRIGTAKLSLATALFGLPLGPSGSLDAGITARALARGAGTAAADLGFSGTFPQTKTASAGAGAAGALIDSLLGSLEIEVVADTTDLDVIGIPVGDLLNALLTPVTGLVNGILKEVDGVPAILPLESLLSNLLDPLLNLLGIGLGDGEVTVHELILAP